MSRSNERGIAMIVALFMVLVLSVIGSSLIFVSRTETMSSLNYKTMSQTRYGAESAVHSAANHLLWIYTGPGTALDPIANYDITQYPVRVLANGRPVVLSSDPDMASNYPIDAVRDAFIAQSRGTLGVSNGSIGYTSHATLLSLSQFTDSVDGELSTLQRWQILGKGTVAGAAAAEVEVSAIIERQKVPLYKYAAFATSPNCQALDFGGGAVTDSYDSRLALVGGVPVLDNHTGNVGTNGGLEASGNPTTINGTLSSPRTGVGNCSVGNITAFESNGGATVEGGLVELAQAVEFKSPKPISPLPPTTAWSTGDCAATAGCTDLGGGDARIAPPAGTTVQLGNVSVGNGDTLYLEGGTYEINSIDVKGALAVVPGTGPVYLKVAGTGFESGVPIEFTANSVSNPSFSAANLQIIYGGTGLVKLRGNSSFAAVVYAPNADTTFAGSGDFYGAIVTKRVTATGGANIHYDRALETGGYTLGNPVMSEFTWKSF